MLTLSKVQRLLIDKKIEFNWGDPLEKKCIEYVTKLGNKISMRFETSSSLKADLIKKLEIQNLNGNKFTRTYSIDVNNPNMLNTVETLYVGDKLQRSTSNKFLYDGSVGYNPQKLLNVVTNETRIIKKMPVLSHKTISFNPLRFL